MELSYIKPVAFNVMLKPIGPLCNLNCTYCYYLEKDRLYQEQKNFKMSYEVLESFIRQYFEAQQVPVVPFVWQGGEPTLNGLDYYRKAVELQYKYAGDRHFTNIFQTNGTLLNDEWCKFFKKYNILVGISIDGPHELHDHYRKTRGGEGSFSKVIRGIELLHKHEVEFNTLTVVNDVNVDHPLEVYNFLKRIGSGYIQFIPIVERIADEDAESTLALVSPDFGESGAKLSSWSVPSRKYGEFLVKIFDEWVRKDVGDIFVQQFDAALANWVGETPGICVFSEICGDALVMEHNGDVYSCDHYVYHENYMGNIMNRSLLSMVNSNEQLDFGKKKLVNLPQKCIECDYVFACHGGCPKNRIATTEQGEYGLNHLCEGYYHFFSHIHPYMQFMADELRAERAPANVMAWARKRDFNTAIRKKSNRKKKSKKRR